MGADFKFVHCADLHLGCRFKGLTASFPGLGDRMTESAFTSFSRIIDLTISEKADLLVISGDIYHEVIHTPQTRYRFAKEIERVKIPCFICLGNHDYKKIWESSIPYPDNAHVFPSEPERVILNIKGEDVEILGRSFSSRLTKENLAASLKGTPDIFSIAVVHCTVDTSAPADTERAPCKVSDIVDNDVDYWALGHIHKRQIIREYPHIVYPGNTQGMGSDETGEKGAYVVTVRDNRVSNMRFVPTQDIIWEKTEIDIRDKDMDTLTREVISIAKRDSILTLHLTGRGALDMPLRLRTDDIRNTLEMSAGCPIILDISTRPEIDLDSLDRDELPSKIVSVSRSLSSKDRGSIINTICSTKASANIRSYFEDMSDEELLSMIEDAKFLVIDKLKEAEQ